MLKRAPKKTKANASEDSWIVEGIVAYLRSPTWKTPVMNFIEDNCGLFTDSEENSLELTEIHGKYKNIVEKLLANYMKELGISEKQFSGACSLKNSDIPRLDLNFEYIWAADDFLLFKRLMIKQNAEIQREALAMFHGEFVEGTSGQPTMSEKDAESITKMLKLSKTTISKEKKLQKMEENDVKLAIQFSRMEMDRLNAIVAEEKRLLEEAIRLSLQQTNSRPPAGNNVDPVSSALTGSPNEQSSASASAHRQLPANSLKQPVKVSQKYDLPEGFSAVSLDKPATYDAPSVLQDAISGKASDAEQKKSSIAKSELPPLRSQKEISSAEAASAWLNRAMEEITAEKHSQNSASEADRISQEELAKRKAYLQQQRDKLLALKRQERAKELSEYIEQKQGTETSGSPELGEIDPEQEKKLAARRAVAERLKREVINKK